MTDWALLVRKSLRSLAEAGLVLAPACVTGWALLVREVLTSLAILPLVKLGMLVSVLLWADFVARALARAVAAASRSDVAFSMECVR
jgi:hypothetical protein